MSTTGTTAHLSDVVAAAHRLWPRELAESWDASGLVCGRPDAPVRRILWAVDPVQAVAAEAVRRDAQLLLTHHPLLLRGAHFLPADTDKGAVVHELVEHGIGLLASHTNADSYDGGVSDALTRACGVKAARPLDPTDAERGSTGIGRVGELAEPVTLEALAQR
ncbi:Nif3-like dinuclear metal center hexameric protein, partial [Amycolatopsis sp. H6(2020)]|nr:Nif3-like dinuclear metal center hexameric protein [Amycolatopsis sp. H6(2020)]